MSDLHRRTVLIQHSQRLRSPLPALMEESPPGPPVPPKDPGYQSSMDGSRPTTAQSGSKRKRPSKDDSSYEFLNGRGQVSDPDGVTPNKRSRSVRGIASDGDISTDETPMQQRNLRRKKGNRNLSNLNLRHAASLGNLPQRQTSPARESKFQEGSLTDKPSEKPPSVYTRFQRTDSDNLMQVDQLMEDYHENLPMSAESVQATIEYEKATRDQRVADITAARQKKEENNGFFRFGKSLAASFNPFAVWDRIWHEQKNELARREMEEAERRRRQKAEAEATYAQLKNTGQLGLKPVALHTHDSAVAFDGGVMSQEHRRTSSYGSVVRTSYDDIASQDGSEVPESAAKQLRSSRSIFHLRKPSMQSLRGGLKRVGSVSNLVGTTNRESSGSVSPTKTDMEPGSSLRKSYSKFDLKKQNHLSKRVSDLEAKLEKARGELSDALVQASPMPQLGNKYQRFTPSGSMRKPKFVPGALPTLPSERVLFPELGFRGDEKSRQTQQRLPRKALDLSTAFDDIHDESEEDMETPREKVKPARVYEGSSKQTSDPHNDKPTSELTELTSELEQDDTMDPNSTASATNGDASRPKKRASNADLNKKLKALDENIKIAKKPASKKRRSLAAKDEDKTFRPGTESNDDDEWDEPAKPAKKRKSTGKSEASPEGKRGKQKSPRGKASKKAAAAKFSPVDTERADEPASTSVDQTANEVTIGGAEGSADELAPVTSVRSSIASEEQLEPVYEEEEETTATTTTVPVKDVPSKPTAKATPARYMHNAVRSRSNSPHKRSGPVQVGTEERMMTRAANAAQLKRTSRSRSPPPARGYKKVEIHDEVVKVVPGQDDVPNLPKGAHGSFESLPDAAGVEVEVVSKKNRGSKDENFEWPDDVF